VVVTKKETRGNGGRDRERDEIDRGRGGLGIETRVIEAVVVETEETRVIEAEVVRDRDESDGSCADRDRDRDESDGCGGGKDRE
jgi:hypothetical protein